MMKGYSSRGSKVEGPVASEAGTVDVATPQRTN